MTPSNTEEKLRFCPQCNGSIKKSLYASPRRIGYSCEQCKTQLSPEYQDWIIWKLLDEKEREIEKLKETLEIIAGETAFSSDIHYQRIAKEAISKHSAKNSK